MDDSRLICGRLWRILCSDGHTHIGVGLDLCQSVLVEFSGVALECLEVVCVLHADSVTLGETALVDIVDPVDLDLDFGLRLEGDDVFALDDVAPPGDGGRDGGRKGVGEQSSNFDNVS